MTVTLALAKEQVGVTGSSRDDMIQQHLDAAIAWVEDHTGKLLTRRSVTSDVFRSFGSYLPLFKGPDPESPVISYIDGDGAEQSISDAVLQGDRLYPPSAGWPAITLNTPIRVTYTAGFETDEAKLDQAVLVLVRDFFDNNGGLSADAARAAESLCRSYRADFI